MNRCLQIFLPLEFLQLIWKEVIASLSQDTWMICTNLPLGGNFILSLMAPTDLHGCPPGGFLTKVHGRCNLSQSPDHALCCSELSDRKTCVEGQKASARLFSSPGLEGNSMRTVLTNADSKHWTANVGSWKQKESVGKDSLACWFRCHTQLLQGRITPPQMCVCMCVCLHKRHIVIWRSQRVKHQSY